MNVIHPHRIFPEDCLPVEAAIWWRDHSDLFLSMLTSPKYHRAQYGTNRSGNLLIYPPKCCIKENILNGRKPRKPSGGSGVRDTKSASFEWINVTLTAEDINTLENEAANLEQLSLAYIVVGSLGFGLSVKFDQLRKSYSCCIYGSDNGNDGKPCGISGQSTDLRDALLVLLFKFNHRLQGSFDGCTNSTTAVQSRRFS